MDDIGSIQLAVKVDYKELTGLVKTANQTEKVLKLVAKDFVKTGSQKNYMRSVNQIVAAQKNLDASSRMTRSQIMKLGAKIQQEVKFTNSLTAATNRLTTAQMNSSKALGNTRNKMNASGMAVQQLGYQVGDFAVQVQSGTSPFVAFSQQATQLTGVLGMLNPKLIGIGAALGIAIPIGSAVARTFFDMGTKAKKAADDVDKLIDALEGIDSVTFTSSLSSVQAIEDKWSNTLKLVREYYATIAEDKKTALFESAGVLVKDLDTIAGKIQALEFQKTAQEGKLDVSGTQELIDYNEEYDKLKRTKEILVGLDTSSKKNLSDSFRVIVDSLTTEGLLTKELTTQLALFAEQANISSVINKEKQNAHDKQVDNLKHFYEFQESEEKKALESKERVAKIVQALKEKEYAGMQGRRGAISPSKTDVALMGMGPIVTDLGEAEARQRKNQLEAIKHFYKEKAKTEAADLAMAKRVAEIKIELRNKELASMQGRTDAKGATKGQIALMGMGPQDTDLEGRLKLQQEIFSSLAKQSKTLEYTVGLSGRELIVGEQKLETFNLINQLQEAGLKYGSEAYNSAVMALDANHKRILAAYDLAEAEKLADEEAIRRNNILLEQYSKIEEELQNQAQKQKELADTIANTFGDAFMSIVDGTKSAKDAFKDMARDIIKQLYRILVVEQMVNSISGAIQSGFGGGGAPQGPMPSGNVVPDTRMFKLANGGVIGGPTSFRTSSGQSGLMGEAGPEAIMPLKRGANGKLGVQMEGGGATTVVQNFNFSANGDDSVKRIIAQAAPKIAQMTKSEIINDRRRGGTMKATFG